MPPFTFLCRLIDTWLAQRRVPPDLVAAASMPDVPWPRLVTLSGVHLMTPALAAALAAPAFAGALPDDLRLYLTAMRDAATDRNLRLRRQLEHVAGLLNTVDVVPVVLKGAIRLVDGLWPETALRFMHDIDLLVPCDSIDRCAQRLQSEGWRPFSHGEAAAGHHVALIHPLAESRVELHTDPLAGGLARLLPATRMLTRARPAVAGSASVAVPALEDQLVHLVAHGMLQHEFLSSGRFLLRDLVEQALLTRCAPQVDVDQARERFASAGQARAWDVSVRLAKQCLPTAWTRPSTVGHLASLLAHRMLLQQRSPLLMQLIGPTGWTVSRLLGHAPSAMTMATEKTALRQLSERLLLFRRKTRW